MSIRKASKTAQIIVKQWRPAPGFLACYTGTRSRSMRRNSRVEVIAEACGKHFMVRPLAKSGKSARLVTVNAANIAPVQGDFFIRVPA